MCGTRIKRNQRKSFPLALTICGNSNDNLHSTVALYICNCGLLLHLFLDKSHTFSRGNNLQKNAISKGCSCQLSRPARWWHTTVAHLSHQESEALKRAICVRLCCKSIFNQIHFFAWKYDYMIYYFH